MNQIELINRTFDEVRAELKRAMEKKGPMNGPHEGYAVIQEELDELWDDVKADHPYAATREAVQVAAMAIRFIVDLTGKPSTQRDRARVVDQALTAGQED